MSEHEATPDEVTGFAGTGLPQVDAVLASLDALEAIPVEEHPAAFEAAHSALRDALSGSAATAPAPSGPPGRSSSA